MDTGLNPQYFQDIEGEIPAKDGDPVALVKNDDGTPGMIQRNAANRPTVHFEKDGPGVWIDGSLEEGRFLEYVK